MNSTLCKLYQQAKWQGCATSRLIKRLAWSNIIEMWMLNIMGKHKWKHMIRILGYCIWLAIYKNIRTMLCLFLIYFARATGEIYNSFCFETTMDSMVLSFIYLPHLEHVYFSYSLFSHISIQINLFWSSTYDVWKASWIFPFPFFDQVCLFYPFFYLCENS